MKFNRAAFSLDEEFIDLLVAIKYTDATWKHHYYTDYFILIYLKEARTSHFAHKQHVALRGQKVIILDPSITKGYFYHFILTRKEYEYFNDFIAQYLTTILKEMGVDYE